MASQAQLNNGGLYAGFGVDGDIRANWLKYGLVTGNVISDDWFAPSGFGNNVIDTTNWAAYKASLSAGNNTTFTERMSKLLYAKVSGKLWLDAAYGRDYCAAANLKDSTVFTMAAKNGDNPNVWTGGISSVPSKNDLVDAYAHMRRDGLSVYDSLWFFTGIAAYGNAANSYYDVELYKNTISYNSTLGIFTSAGTAWGHTEWLFDASGNVTQTGDMIIACTFLPGSPPIIDVRLWVSQSTFSTYFGGALTPKYFNFNGTYNTAAGSTYGYASVVSKAGTTAWGAGISNYSGVPANDTTTDAPWGTTNSSSGWSPYYQATQFIEVGLNLTRIGVDPALYATLNPCQSMFSDILFASRSSASFTADLKDFMAPLTFLRPPVMDFGVNPDTLRCNHTAGTITLTNNSTAGYYTWKTINGGTITGANGDSSQLNVSKAGSYIVSASPALGCPATKVDTIVVPIDTFPPVASANVGMLGSSLLQFYGGDTAKSDYSTPFGKSHGLLWNWTGPGSFTSTVQNPINDTVWGTYHLTVTEKRNGCTDTASVNVLSSMFAIMLTNGLKLEGTAIGQQIDLTFQDLDESLDQSFVVERSDGVNEFQAIGSVFNPHAGGTDVAGSFSFMDQHPLNGTNLYRVKAVTTSGATYYSPTITIGAGKSPLSAIYLATNNPENLMLFVNTATACDGVLVKYSVSGQLLEKQNVSFGEGVNTLSLPHPVKHAVEVMALLINGRVAWCQKVLY
ncbi:hypothetical protein GCM10011511_51170 [Puia dinghuensis]|uniref:Ig-like domain-containing protein n=2 Tax=Puia dinghuensis TaxID=1792502 RepID=A0A8J2UI93_9BACT|nr:hypothetical protein GCM10011511_51170 [Puia dinghuensis]